MVIFGPPPLIQPQTEPGLKPPPRTLLNHPLWSARPSTCCRQPMTSRADMRDLIMSFNVDFPSSFACFRLGHLESSWACVEIMTTAYYPLLGTWEPCLNVNLGIARFIVSRVVRDVAPAVHKCCESPSRWSAAEMQDMRYMCQPFYGCMTDLETDLERCDPYAKLVH